MFINKPYYEVNREERHYCFLLAHAILSSNKFNKEFNTLLNEVLNIDLDRLTPEVYLEAAALRDYWRDLGNPNTYSNETHEFRMSVITEILALAGYDDIYLEQYDFFWTTKLHKKLWTPGRWSESAIKSSGLDNLRKFKWTFNAKPDILLDYESNVILIEAKVESPIGRNKKGYNQLEVQYLISKLLKHLVPVYREKDFSCIILSNDESATVTWADVARISNSSDIDNYTRKCLSTLI